MSVDKKIILHELRFEPSQVRLNIKNPSEIWKTQKDEKVLVESNLCDVKFNQCGVMSHQCDYSLLDISLYWGNFSRMTLIFTEFLKHVQCWKSVNIRGIPKKTGQIST